MQKPKKKQKNWVVFSQIGLQMTITIVLGTYVGYRLDGYYTSKQPVFTLIFSLTFIGLALYQVIKQVSNFDE